MTEGNDFHEAEPKLFTALLRPHRALSRKGFLVLMACLSVVSFGAGMVFLWMGAWPVFGFFGLDVLAIYVAFRIYDRRARATEEITVTPSEIRVRRVSPRGDVVEWAFNPLWVQVDRVEHAEFSRGRRVSIARFLGAEEKASFLSALLDALQDARRGPSYNPVT
jgi:uncharacterized membrane protein